ncbi:MAG: MFS transporter [Acidobacteriaceae bacterium]|nr:MFS transporter [Acidobacteriaceae bacterium]
MLSDTQLQEETYSAVTRRLMPILFICYILSYIDRINIGFAKLQMAGDLRLNNAAYGAGAGIFFIGYFLFEVPANLLLLRIGASVWLSAIVIGWGIASTSTAFVGSVPQFYLVRFILGTLEAGFFPGVILYLTFWYPKQYHGRMLSVFMSAIPLSGVLSGAISGWIMSQMNNVAGLRAWQWLYILEGIPPVLAGLLAFALFPDSPAKAQWLRSEQKELVQRMISDERSGRGPALSRSDHFLHALKNPAVWLLCLVFFGVRHGKLWHWILAAADTLGKFKQRSVGHRLAFDDPLGRLRSRYDPCRKALRPQRGTVLARVSFRVHRVCWIHPLIHSASAVRLRTLCAESCDSGRDGIDRDVLVPFGRAPPEHRSRCWNRVDQLRRQPGRVCQSLLGGEGSRCDEQHGMAITPLSWVLSRCRYRRPTAPLSIATESVAFVRTTHERMKRQGGKLNANATISD